MSRGGTGSASIILIFAVLCVTIFTIVSLSSALMDRAITDREAELVMAYYAADTRAEQIFAEILAADDIPQNIMGVEITSDWDWDLLALRVSFTHDITEDRKLYVEAVLFDEAYEIVAWQMRSTEEWEADESLNLWPGFFD